MNKTSHIYSLVLAGTDVIVYVGRTNNLEKAQAKYEGSMYEMRLLETVSKATYVRTYNAFIHQVKRLEAEGCELFSYSDVVKGRA